MHPRAELVDAEDFEIGAHPPVGEGRFVEAVFVVEVGDGPLVTVDHLDGSVGEARFVAVDKRQGPDAGDEGKEGQQGEPQW